MKTKDNEEFYFIFLRRDKVAIISAANKLEARIPSNIKMAFKEN